MPFAVAGDAQPPGRPLVSVAERVTRRVMVKFNPASGITAALAGAPVSPVKQQHVEHGADLLAAMIPRAAL